MYIDYEIFFITSICYIIGSFPSGLVISFILNKNDPRSSGSQNIGATNIARISGWQTGFVTLILDVAKAFIPLKCVLINYADYLSVAIFAIFLGHLFPVWLKFKGGKGIAVLIGILMAYNIVSALVFLATWVIIALIFRYSSLSALIACIINLLFFIMTEDESLTVMMILTFFIYAKHSSNINRLFTGTEPRINLKKKK